MIKLFPSRRVKTETRIDFKLLEKICTDVFEQGFDRKLNIYCKVWKSKEKETSTMERTKGRCHYVMDLDTEGNRRYVFGSILHELRHAFQEYVFNFTTVARFASYNAYYNSKEEKDARKQERLTTEVMRFMILLRKLKKNLKDLT